MGYLYVSATRMLLHSVPVVLTASLSIAIYNSALQPKIQQAAFPNSSLLVYGLDSRHPVLYELTMLPRITPSGHLIADLSGSNVLEVHRPPE